MFGAHRGRQSRWGRYNFTEKWEFQKWAPSWGHAPRARPSGSGDRLTIHGEDFQCFLAFALLRCMLGQKSPQGIWGTLISFLEKISEIEGGLLITIKHFFVEMRLHASFCWGGLIVNSCPFIGRCTPPCKCTWAISRSPARPDSALSLSGYQAMPRGPIALEILPDDREIEEPPPPNWFSSRSKVSQTERRRQYPYGPAATKPMTCCLKEYTGVEVFIGSKVQCLLFWNFRQRGERGRNERSGNFRSKAHRTFDPRNNSNPV